MKKTARTRLIEERKHQQWSQQQVADLIGTTRHNVSRWESGLTAPGPYFRAKLCELFGKQVRELGLLPADQHQSTDTAPEEDVVPETALFACFPEGPDLWSVPYPRNPFFTGRGTLLQTLHEQLNREHTMALTQSWAVSGLGGIGKTQIALEYAYRYRQDYTAVFWISAATWETLLTGLVMITERLQLPEKDERDQNKVVLAIKKWLATHQKWLLIVDNADDVTVVQDILPLERFGHLLLTTRAQALGPLAQRIEVETMGMVEGTLFLLRRAKLLAPEVFLDDVPQEQLAAAEAIVIEMDFLPLALDQAGAYIEEVGCSLSTYLELYRAHRRELLRRRGQVSGDHPESVATTWSLNFQQIEQANPAAAELLRLCAFLEPDAIPEELLIGGSAALGPVLQPVARNTFRLNEAIEKLRTFSLVQRDPETGLLHLHRLVQAVLKDALAVEDQRQWAERAVRATSIVFPENTELTPWPYDRRFLSQAQACSVLIQDFALVFVEAAVLLFRTANDLKEYSFYEQAELLYKQALHIQEQTCGLEHPDVACSLNKLADLFRTQGKHEQAEALYQQAVRIWGRSEHPDVARALNGLALLSRDLGKYEQAEQFGQRALHIQEQVLGPEHLNIVFTLNNLAIVYQDLGKYEQAEQFFQRALHIWERELGPEHPNVAYPLNNLGNLYQSLGKYEQAEQFFQRALHIWEQELGPEQPRVAYPLYNLGNLYQILGKYKQAEPLYQRALHNWEQAFGLEHPNVAHTLHGLADLYSNLGMDQQAELFYQRSLSTWESTLDGQHPGMAEALHDFAVFRQSRSQYPEAARLYLRALEMREKILGALDPLTAATRTKYTALLQSMNLAKEKVVADLPKKI